MKVLLEVTIRFARPGKASRPGHTDYYEATRAADLPFAPQPDSLIGGRFAGDDNLDTEPLAICCLEYDLAAGVLHCTLEDDANGEEVVPEELLAAYRRAGWSVTAYGAA